MAIEYEANRQADILEEGGSIDQETRLFDTKKNETRSMRSKEDAHDYRYFPDPDLLPLELTEDFISKIKKEIPELPDEKKKRFVDKLAVDQNGQKRKFGSRKHYSFSHKGYQKESQRITQAVAERYGNNSFIQAWQTDNEFGCHETTYSWCQSSLQEFRNWLQVKYQNIEKLNEEWGNVFWSMEYSSFEDIDLPNLTVTEANPAHHFAFRRFSSDQDSSFLMM